MSHPTTLAPRAASSAVHQFRLQAMQAAGQGRFADARKLLESALAQTGAPKMELLCDIAAVALRAGDWAQSIAMARHVLGVDAGHDAARYTLAMSLAAIGSHAEAVEHFDALSRSERFCAETPELAALAVTEGLRLRPAPASVPAAAASATVVTSTAIAAPVDVAPALPSMREFVWGPCDPFASFPTHLSPGGTSGWYSDHPVFDEMIRERRPRRLIEIGSLLGASAIHIAGLLDTHQIDGELTCVDTFLGSREHFFDLREHRAAMLTAGRYNFFDEFLGNVSHAGVAHRITPFPQSSTIAARICREAGMKFDFIYLDASHEYEDVLCDLRAWWPLVAEGGVLVGDDFEHPWFGVIRAACEFADEVGQRLETRRAWASSPLGGRENTKFVLTR